MKFSLSIPITTVVVLLLTIIINILSLKISLEKYFPEYISHLNDRFKTENSVSPDGIQALLSVKNLDPDTQKDYQVALSEISRLSSSLESLSKNPELYIETGTGHNSGTRPTFHIFTTETITENYKKSLLSVFTQPFNFASGSHEQHFIQQIFRSLLITNICWLSFVAIFYTLWIRKIFRPIHTIISRLSDISFSKNSQKIHYKKKNEFYPLVYAINELQSSLSNQELIRDQFLADISHEIRTPITAVWCLLEAINDNIIALDSHTIKILQFEMSRLTNITEHIMSHERFLSESSTPMSRKSVPLNAIITSIALQYASQLSKNDQKIICHIEKNAYIFVSEEHFAQILHNIFSNFHKYAGKNTVLDIFLETKKSHQILIFRDNGVGIPHEELSLVREKFFRKDTGRTHNGQLSMGIGFSIIDRIVFLENATMKLSTNTPNGLIISIKFPKNSLQTV